MLQKKLRVISFEDTIKKFVYQIVPVILEIHDKMLKDYNLSIQLVMRSQNYHAY